MRVGWVPILGLASIAVLAGCPPHHEPIAALPDASSDGAAAPPASAATATGSNPPYRGAPPVIADGGAPPTRSSAASKLTPAVLRRFKPKVPAAYRGTYDWIEVTAQNGYVAWELRSLGDAGGPLFKAELEDYRALIAAKLAPILMENVSMYEGYRFVVGYDYMGILMHNMWFSSITLPGGKEILTPDEVGLDAKGLGAL